jgi:hypothetical protein
MEAILETTSLTARQIVFSKTEWLQTSLSAFKSDQLTVLATAEMLFKLFVKYHSKFFHLPLLDTCVNLGIEGFLTCLGLFRVLLEGLLTLTL